MQLDAGLIDERFNCEPGEGCTIECFGFFFNDTATTEIYTLSLHDALPISQARRSGSPAGGAPPSNASPLDGTLSGRAPGRSEEHTSELQSRPHLVCRL